MPRVAAAQTQWHWGALLVLVALCTYLHVPLSTGGRVLVPSYPTVVLMPLLLLVVRRDVSQEDVVFVAKVALVLLLSIALSPGYIYILEKIFGLIQCCMAVTVAILIVRLMRQMRVEVLERALLVLWILVMVGAVLEVFGVTREASDAFRAWAYGGKYTVYGADWRDMEMVGRLRPKVFSIEPSHVTKLFIASVNAWLLVRVSWSKALIVGGATLAMVVLMGSPMLLASAAITLVILISNRRAKLSARVTMIVAMVLIGVAVGAYYAGSTFSKIGERVERIGDSASSARGDDTGSEAQRVVYPYLTLVDTWRRWPVFGVGVAGVEVVAQHNRLPLNNPKMALGTNAFAEIGTFLGIVGSAWFLVLLLRQARQTGVHRLGVLSITIVLFSQLMGGVVSFQYWGFIALLWGAHAVADSEQTDR